MTENKLLFWSMMFVSIYWVSGAFVPNYHSTFASVFLLVFGGIAASRYVPEAWHVVIRRRRNYANPGGGAHLAAYGVALLAIGAIYQGTFGVLWVWFGQPEAWIGTPVSGFGRYIMAAGFALLFFSPDMEAFRLQIPHRNWLLIAGTIALIMAFYLGLQVGAAERSDMRSSIHYCPAKLPVKGKASGTVHMPGGPYYQRTNPDACFASTDVASAFGFRRIVGAK